MRPQIIYINSEAKRAQYVFDPNGGAGGETEYSGTVEAAETKTIATLTYNADGEITFTNTGSVILQFSLRTDAATPGGTPLILIPGDTMMRTMAALNDDSSANVLVVTHSGPGTGAYTVVVE